MTHLDDYQLEKLGDLFNVEVIEGTLDADLDSLTAQQESVLRFIVNNPNEEFISLQNTFRMSDIVVISLVREYGTPSEDYEEIRELEERIREANSN
jgi:hypothetical protein